MTDRQAPTLLWLRRDLRLGDNPALHAALATGRPLVPVFVLDEVIEDLWGIAPKWRLSKSLADLSRRLAAQGSRLILRRGTAVETLLALVEETGAKGVVWGRQYDARAIERDSAVKAALKDRGIEAQSVNASLMFEPWTVETGSGAFYKVYTPFWKAVRGRDPGTPLDAPTDLSPPEHWPASEDLVDWGLERAMDRGGAIVEAHANIGEEAALARLDTFLDDRLATYGGERDRPDIAGTSNLSENFATGEVSPRLAYWRALNRFEGLSGKAADSAQVFLQEIVWREFSYHLLYHTPHIVERSWREEWDSFPWRDDNEDAEAWRRGMTGYEMVDAGMRELYVTGRMHNRMRMLTASLLTKHLMTHWRIGEAWFRDCLIDWDIASNSMGWQWAAGSGPDATPYFRVFNPLTQADKFDKNANYRNRFLAEGRTTPHQDALAFYEAAPRSWRLDRAAPYPQPIIGHKEGRERALAAYQNRRG
ncbi:MAG: deoxyribodipyrimidine photo-lyase [Pseudomonadota bacterium]